MLWVAVHLPWLPLEVFDTEEVEQKDIARGARPRWVYLELNDQQNWYAQGVFT